MTTKACVNKPSRHLLNGNPNCVSRPVYVSDGDKRIRMAARSFTRPGSSERGTHQTSTQEVKAMRHLQTLRTSLWVING
jgi:hypothetical protein